MAILELLDDVLPLTPRFMVNVHVLAGWVVGRLQAKYLNELKFQSIEHRTKEVCWQAHQMLIRSSSFGVVVFIKKKSSRYVGFILGKVS